MCSRVEKERPSALSVSNAIAKNVAEHKHARASSQQSRKTVTVISPIWIRSNCSSDAATTCIKKLIFEKFDFEDSLLRQLFHSCLTSGLIVGAAVLNATLHTTRNKPHHKWLTMEDTDYCRGSRFIGSARINRNGWDSEIPTAFHTCPELSTTPDSPRHRPSLGTRRDWIQVDV